MEIVGTEKRIPDGIIYVNGLPLVVFEFKTTIEENTTIHDAYKQLTVRYRRDIPELLSTMLLRYQRRYKQQGGFVFAPYEFIMHGEEWQVRQKMLKASAVCLH